MKLIRATINNFRLLKGLTLDFSCDEDKNLTVVRAANETGKTTCKTALLWGLFGNRALPGEGKKYPLFPSDMKETLMKAEVSVEIEFETDQVVTIGRGHHEIQKKQYRLYRSCIEYPGDGGVVRRESEGVVLFARFIGNMIIRIYEMAKFLKQKSFKFLAPQVNEERIRLIPVLVTMLKIGK